jgi:hypothetical protein
MPVVSGYDGPNHSIVIERDEEQLRVHGQLRRDGNHCSVPWRINVGRGNRVVGKDLIAALDSGQLS